MSAQKILTVASEVQKVVMTEVLLAEIATGFWKDARPADHADNWKGVTVVVGTSLGATGFDIPRNYNFVNPDFFKKAEAKLLESALKADANITVKQLKKQLLLLNQILGARLKEVGGPVTKLSRGRKAEPSTEPTEKTTKLATTRKVAAQFVEPEEAPAEPVVKVEEGTGLAVTAEA